MITNELLQGRLEQLLGAEPGASVRALKNSITPTTAFRDFHYKNTHNQTLSVAQKHTK